MIKASIITIGDEILVGQTVDTNSAWIASQLRLIGIKVAEIISISDDSVLIKEAVDRELSKSDIVFITGGLGPTQDDITKKTLTEYFNDELKMNARILEKVEGMFKSINRPMLDVNRQQAMLPSTAEIIENDLGTASGMWFRKNKQSVISMPGVPFEMKGLMLKLIPLLKKNYPLNAFYHKTIHFQGIGESQLAHDIAAIETACRSNGISVAYLPSPGIVRLRLTGTLDQQTEIDSTLNQLQALFPEQVFGFEEDSLESVIGGMLKKNSASVGTVESCTGGAIAARIVTIPGSSVYFKGAVIAYSYELKEELIDVNHQTLVEFGAVSQQVIEQMAVNGRQKLKTDYCIATSGIAGPDGGTDLKPVGTVWVGIASARGVVSKQFQFKHNRERNIELTVVYALNFLRRTMLEHENKAV
ncbi:MAG: CinA family nicotinamide mononucleotide deamidase-related protein [Bacteroidetes bacterium]|nr:CinA family nicotinamide mononucleotide deamidase-related protein [Bacteroidota bacterium]